MEHPYKEYENSKTWNAVARLIKDLVDNNDIELLTPKEYVIGYICKGLLKQTTKNKMDKKTFDQLLSKYSHLGKKYIEETGATMIGHAPHIAPEAYLNMAFEPLSKEEISQLEGRLHEIIPDPYKDFLMNVSNGATVCCELFLYGYRRYSDKDKGIIYVFEPYDLEDINCRDWITKPSPNMFFFGSYDWNGDELYMDRESLEIVLCSTPDLTPLYKWKSFDDFLQEEVNRLYTMFDENGVQLDESSSPLPGNNPIE